MSEPVLSLNKIEKTYNPGQPNAVHILKGVDFALCPGEVVAMVAPSGAGKSTLLHIAGLLDSASSGNVVLAGQDLTTADDKTRTISRRREIGFVYQFHHLLPEFTALENVVIPQLANGTARDEAEAQATILLERLGLSERAAHRPAMMSGGEQQRVALARALANDPAVLLADEPTGNLDPETSDRVFDLLLARVREAGQGALIATHNFDLARKMDRAVKLDHGVLVEAKLG